MSKNRPINSRLLGLIKAIGDAVEADAPLTIEQYVAVSQALDPHYHADSLVTKRVKAGVQYIVLDASAIELYTGLGPAAIMHAQKVNAFFGEPPAMTAHQRLAMANGPRGGW